MVLFENKTLKMMYNDQLEYIDCPKNAKYEDCVEIALARFEIPLKFKKSIQLTNESDEIFDKCTFEYYNLLFPNPSIIFYIKIHNEEMKNQKTAEQMRTPLDKLTNKRKYRDENIGVPVTRQNCFLGSLHGLGSTETFEEHTQAAKKHKSFDVRSETKEFSVVKRTISRKSIRI